MQTLSKTSDDLFAALPEWVRKLNPDRIHSTGDDSILLEWFEKQIALDFYPDGDVVALAPDPVYPEKTAYCTVNIEDQVWIEIFARIGWTD